MITDQNDNTFVSNLPEANLNSFDADEGFPSKDDPFVQKFLAGRAALEAEEAKQRSDYKFRTKLTPTARKACRIVDKIRKHEQATLWTGDYEDMLAKTTGYSVYPGMMFNLAKERMEKSTLWKIVKRFPKGALLHCHLAAMVDLEWLIRLCLSDQSGRILYFCSNDKDLSSAANRLNAQISFTHIPAKPMEGSDNSDLHDTELRAKQMQAGATIWTPEYCPGTPVPAIHAAQSFPEGGFEGFVAWMLTRTTITPDESLKHHEGVNEIWAKFRSTFGIVDDLLFYEPIFRKFIHKLFTELVEDGVRWVDIRTTFCRPFLRVGQLQADADFCAMFEVFENELKKFQATDKGQHFWGARFIWTGLRGVDKYTIVNTMKDCVLVKKRYPHLVSGFDFVGQEECGRTLSDLIPEVFWFQKYCAENEVSIPFFFHAGETNESGGPTDGNLYDAILLGTRRIGHGFSLFKHPLLIELVKERKILIESCPISNEVLRLTSSILSHPLPALLSRGVPASLCNDDPAILGQGQSGMTHDFWQALQGWENLGLAGLGSLAENSVRWAAFEDAGATQWKAEIEQGRDGASIRAVRLREWEDEWERYCLWIVDTFGESWLNKE